MNTNLDFIKKALREMAADKFNNMCGSEISEDVFNLIDGHEDIVSKKAFELMKNNSVVMQDDYCTIRAMDGFDYDLIGDWDMYDEFEGVDELTDEIIANCSSGTKDEITYDALYNYDALWMTAIQKSFPDKVTDVQCGWGTIETIQETEDERDEI